VLSFPSPDKEKIALTFLSEHVRITAKAHGVFWSISQTRGRISFYFAWISSIAHVIFSFVIPICSDRGQRRLCAYSQIKPAASKLQEIEDRLRVRLRLGGLQYRTM
jgi:hypothetical protein